MGKRLADRLDAARHELFVGRDREKALFVDALREDSALSVLHIYGPGGVGKTTLLRECSLLCEAAGVAAVMLDARALEATPHSLIQALAAGFNLPSSIAIAADDDASSALEALGAHLSKLPGRCVIFVDTYELLTPLDGWLREKLLPALPDTALFVLAGRHAPAPAWSADAAWGAISQTVPLRNLADSESHDYLNRRSVAGGQHTAILNFTHGHPLALSLVADLFAQRHPDDTSAFSFEPEEAPEVVNTLLNHFIQQEPDSMRRSALQASALVRLTTEDLLAALLGVDDAHEPFRWLRTRSFIESVRDGVFPHDMAREVIVADLRWRNPSMYRELHNRARRYYAAQLRFGDAIQQQRVLSDYVFLHRDNPVVRPFLDWRETGTLLPGPARADEMETLINMVERHEGRESAQLAAHWFARQPHGVLALRDVGGDIAGFVSMISLAQASDEDLRHDPATRATREYLRNHTPLRSGEESTLIRFWMSAEHHQNISPEQSLIFIHVVRHYLTTPSLAFTFFACADPDFWAPILNYAGAQRLREADFAVGGNCFGVYGHDWRALPPFAWLEMLGEREVSSAPPAKQTAPAHSLAVLSQDEFYAAVQLALRGLLRPHGIAGNPLLHCRLVTHLAGWEADEAARALALQQLLTETCESLRSTPRDKKFYLALHYAYLEPAPTQEQAAEIMDVPFSTFRRHLKSGVSRVCELLWQQEIGR